MNTSASFALDSIAGAAAERGLAWRGALHPEPDDKVPAFPDGAPALTVFLLGWTCGEQWPAFARAGGRGTVSPTRLIVGRSGRSIAFAGWMPLLSIPSADHPGTTFGAGP